MNSITRPLMLALLLPLALLLLSLDTSPPLEMVVKMFSSAKQVRTLSYKMEKVERINGKLITQVSTVKLNKTPFKVYTKQLSPQAGLEVLYVEGQNSNKAIINPNSFPWVNISLDPYGSTMRNNQHHTIHDAGFDLFVEILEYLFNKYGDETADMLSTGQATWKGKACTKVEFDNPNFKYQDYTVLKGENIESIADKFRISSYLILENNPDISDHHDVEPGQTIRIPNDYAPKLSLLIDNQTHLPVLIRVFDQKGLLEQYSFSEVKINPVFAADEFTEDFKDYSF